MSNFPLYDNLINEIKTEEDLTTKQKDEFIKLVDNIDENASELIYALIRVYQLENSENKNTFTLPFNGTFINESIKFDLNELPNKLKQILYKFIVLNKTK
jgi:hypothetical protein